ncbi:MAG: serine/threonine protein kinase [Cryomorphaceae bacterium]|jgi:serine/threonine protein kinase
MSSNKNYGALLAQGLSGDEEKEAGFPSIEGFEILKKLGAGGMGEVYLAYDTELDREVALKVFHQGSLDPMSLERIRQESETMARAQHPHVLAIYHVKLGSDSGTPFSLVLEYAAGGDLAHKIRSKGALSLGETITLCLQICDGLSKIHELGIIHRDIKPANILLTETGTAKIADLGIAKDTMADSLTMTGTYMGSILYVAPEQMSGAESQIDGRADIWSMGILIYEMLVGNTPKAVLESELMQPLPENIRPVVRQCLMQNPENRYQNAGDLKEALIKSQQLVRMPEQNTKTSPIASVVVASAIALVLGAGLYYFSTDDKPSKLPSNEPVLTTEKDAFFEGKSVTADPAVIASPAVKAKDGMNLIDLLNDPLQPDRGRWSLSEEGRLSCARARSAACISFPVEDSGNVYDLSFNVVRTEGRNSLAVYLPTASGSLTFDLDAWNMQLAGLQALDGQNLKQHDQVFKFGMTNGQQYHLLIKVRKDHVEIEIDDKVVYHCDISEKKASVIAIWGQPRKHPLSIAAWNSAMTFSDLTLKKIK